MISNAKILNGQAIDWVGSTKFILELFDSSCTIVNLAQKAKYVNGGNFNIPYEVKNVSDFYSELKNETIVYINSFPNYKNTLQEIDSFYTQIEQLHNDGVILVAFMHFNTLQYINKIPKLLLWLNFMDYIFTFNKDSDFAHIVYKYLPWKSSSICEFWLPYNMSREIPIEKENLCVYMWRFACFKNPQKMIDLETEEIRFEFHGCWRTIETKTLLFDKYQKAVYVNANWTKRRIVSNGVFEYTEAKDRDVLVYWTYKNQEGIEVMKKAMFAYSGYKLPKQNYWVRFEYSMCEYIDYWCVCIFSEHFLKNVFVQGKSLFDHDVFISYDFENPEATKKRMLEVLHDNELRKEIIQKQDSLLYAMHNPDYVQSDIFKQINDKVNNQLDKESFYSLLIGHQDYSQAIEPADLKLIKKEKRTYVQKWTKLLKDKIIL